MSTPSKLTPKKREDPDHKEMHETEKQPEDGCPLCKKKPQPAEQSVHSNTAPARKHKEKKQKAEEKAKAKKRKAEKLKFDWCK
mmetsp:Transcript_115779/g.248780  ORF Transcript_115779/g.248780 Transcript_115779/m.248780 type:complete len:83 (+) Transcript_115779:303-551(+)